jgi:hypothetical protein
MYVDKILRSTLSCLIISSKPFLSIEIYPGLLNNSIQHTRNNFHNVLMGHAQSSLAVKQDQEAFHAAASRCLR